MSKSYQQLQEKTERLERGLKGDNSSITHMNWEDLVRSREYSPEAMLEKKTLRKASVQEGAHIEVKLFIGQVPKIWEDRDVFHYFKRFGNIMEARIIRDRTPLMNHKGCAFLKCLNFHEAENILKIHQLKKC